MSTLKVFLADDHPVYRTGVRTALRDVSWVEWVGEAADGQEALILLRTQRPDVVIVDLKMPGMGGIQLINSLKNEALKCKIIVLSQGAEDDELQKLVEMDVDGHVLKSESMQELIRSLEAIKRGERYFSPSVGEHFFRLLKGGLSAPTKMNYGASDISPREREVIGLIIAGHTVREMAQKLSCSENTVKAHKANLMRKIGAANSAEIASWAKKNGLG
jgi:DNA-binding NarL/FixJ family response regulator